MKEIPNKSLAALLVVAIVVSVVGTWLVVNQKPGALKTTGAAVDTGTATMDIQTTTSIKFTDNAVAWGAVSVDTTGGYTNCTLDTDGGTGVGCSQFTPDPDGMTITNDGNTKLKVELSNNATAAEFIGGTGSTYEYKFVDPGAKCGNFTGSTNYGNVPTVDTIVCDAPGGLKYADGSDTMTFHLKIVIPYDAETGAKSATWTATGTEVA